MCSRKIGYAKGLSLPTKSNKKGIWSLSTVRIKPKKQFTFHSCWFERKQRVVCIASSKLSEPKRFVHCLNIVEEKYITEQQPN